MQLKPAVIIGGAAVLLWLLLSLASPSAQIAKVDGTALTSGGTPSLVSCGTSPSLVGTDTAGTITVGSGVVLSCQLNFSTTLSAAPPCVVTPSLSTVTIGATTTATALTIAVSATIGGGKITYFCPGL